MKKPSIDNVNDRIRFVILKYKEKKTLIDKLHLKLLNRYYPNNDDYEREICNFLIENNYMEDLNGGPLEYDESTGEILKKRNYVFNYVIKPKTKPAYKSKLFHPSEWIEWFYSKTIVRISFWIGTLYGIFRSILDVLGITLNEFFHNLMDLFNLFNLF